MKKEILSKKSALNELLLKMFHTVMLPITFCSKNYLKTAKNGVNGKNYMWEKTLKESGKNPALSICANFFLFLLFTSNSLFLVFFVLIWQVNMYINALR